MISLKSLIPEIKIVPNTKEPREGDQWYWKNNPKHINTIISITNEGHQITFIYEKPDGSPVGPVSLQSLKEYIRMGEIKLVRATNEIKIIPQLVIPKLGDKYEVFLGDNQWHQGIITRVPYDEWTGISLTYPNKGYGQGKAEMGIGDIKQFNELIREKRLRKIKDVNEIKIVPNQHQLQIGDILLYDYNDFENKGDKIVREDNEHMEGYIVENNSGERYWVSKKTILNCIKNKTIKIIKNINEIKIIPNTRELKPGDILDFRKWTRITKHRQGIAKLIRKKEDGYWEIENLDDFENIYFIENSSLIHALKEKEIKFYKNG